jgi:decaprenyl-phosphate phosphoribosyltransferase
VTAEAHSDAPARPLRSPALLRLVRPRQWVKNVLVFAAPFAAGDLLEGDVPLRTVAGFAALCLAASGTYCVNDAADAEADRRHPDKRHRPVASGEVAVPVAFGLGALLLACGMALAAAVDVDLLLVVACYVALTLAYSWRLKHLPVVDIAAIAGGFILRAVAGGAAAPVPISQWFLIVTGFGSLFIVAGKRSAEHLDLGDEAGNVRTTLAQYPAAYLRFVRSMAASACVLAYCLWAFERADELRAGEVWYELSIIPFVLGILHYALRLEQGAGAAPEEVVLRDRMLQVLGLVWLVVFALGVADAT